MDGMKISLSKAEIQQAAFVGVQRHLYAIKMKLPEEDGYRNAWQNRIEGALAEMAFAGMMNLYWAGKADKLTKGDVNGWEIRMTSHAEGSLLLHRRDLDDAPYVLMTGGGGAYQVRGWIMGRDGKQEKYWGDRANQNRPAFWVPQSDLNPIESHIDYITAHQGVTT